MKTTFSTISKAVALLAFVSASGIAAAVDSQTLVVTASVTGMCKFSSSNTLTMSPAAAIDPSGTADVTMTRTLNYNCTKGVSPTGGVTTTTANGAARNMTSGAESLAYTLGWTGDTVAGSGFGTGTAKPVVFTGTITAAQYQNAAALTYTDNVVLNINP